MSKFDDNWIDQLVVKASGSLTTLHLSPRRTTAMLSPGASPGKRKRLFIQVDTYAEHLEANTLDHQYPP